MILVLLLSACHKYDVVHHEKRSAIPILGEEPFDTDTTPVVDFTYNVNSIDSCIIHFTNRSLTYSKLLQLEWFFMDDSTHITDSTKCMHIYNKAGLYNVTLYAKTTLGDFSKTQKIRMKLYKPVALFSWKYDPILSTQIHFTNLSYNGLKFKWDFGDGTSSVERHPPPHIYYESSKLYTITLEVTGMSGQAIQHTKRIIIL